MMRVRVKVDIKYKRKLHYTSQLKKTEAFYSNCHIANYADISKFPINPLLFNVSNLLYLHIYTILF